MSKTALLFFAIVAFCAFQAFAGESGGVHGGARYSSGGHTWAEGTISKSGKDGHFSIRGSISPYAGTYSTYHNGYYSTPEAQRRAYTDGYHDKFAYTWNDNNLTDYDYTIADPDNFTIYEEPNYGADFSTWTYTTEPHTYHYGDLHVGDRVVVGYGKDGRAEHVYRVNPGHRK